MGWPEDCGGVGTAGMELQAPGRLFRTKGRQSLSLHTSHPEGRVHDLENYKSKKAKNARMFTSGVWTHFVKRERDARSGMWSEGSLNKPGGRPGRGSVFLGVTEHFRSLEA